MKSKIIAFCLLAIAAVTASAQTTSFEPGKEWLDNNGTHINAHGGCVIPVGNCYYWYGEKRANSSPTSQGVEVYSSTDLLNWTDEGTALAVTHTQGDDIEEGCIVERPKVVFCKNTNKYVMLFHLELKDKGYSAARVGFAVSDTPCGPFKFIRSLRPNAGKWPAGMTDEAIKQAQSLSTDSFPNWWTPEWRIAIAQGMFLNRDLKGGQMSRDMTVYIDDDGKAYHLFSSEDNLTLHLAELTDDYLDYTGRFVRIAPGGQNEAPTLLKHDGKYWLITSGCTGWAPNKARMFSATSLFGEWQQHESPFVGDNADKSFNSQGTYILKAGDTFIFMADIWNPKALATSRYVWLPIEFSAAGTPVLTWHDSWNLK